jgi:hypothetical protein
VYCEAVLPAAVQPARQLATAGATAMHSTCAQKAAWGQWRAVAAVAVAVRLVLRVWSGMLGRKVAAKVQQKSLTLRTVKYFLQRLQCCILLYSSSVVHTSSAAVQRVMQCCYAVLWQKNTM